MSRPAPERVVLLGDAQAAEVRPLLEELEPWLTARVAAVERVDQPREWERERDPEATPPDLVVVVGGDGAVLDAVRAFQDSAPAFVGIHAGRVGFLASTTATRWMETLEAVLAGEGRLEERMRIEAEWQSEGETRRIVALNEFVLQRGAHQGMLVARLDVDGQWVNDYRADGLIVATPSGSTAYSLSAGGPILTPRVEGLVVTPLSSQGLSTRPIVLSAQGELRLRVLTASGLSTLAVDGQAYHGIAQGTSVLIRRHPVPVPLYAMPDLDPYRRLRSRLGWGSGLDEEPPAE